MLKPDYQPPKQVAYMPIFALHRDFFGNMGIEVKSLQNMIMFQGR